MRLFGNEQGPPLRLLMYHHVGPFTPASEQKSVYCHVNRFARQMRYLAHAPLDVISMERVWQALSGQVRLRRASVVLTFDDAFQDFHDYAWPILKAWGLPAIVYAVAERLGQADDWSRLPAVPGSESTMTARTLRSLAREELMEIGGHTATHPFLSSLSAVEQEREIAGARDQLASILGQDIRHFAYPYGDFDQAARDRVQAAGYVSAVTTQRGRAEQVADPWQIPRIGVSFKNSIWRYIHKTSFL